MVVFWLCFSQVPVSHPFLWLLSASWDKSKHRSHSHRYVRFVWLLLYISFPRKTDVFVFFPFPPHVKREMDQKVVTVVICLSSSPFGLPSPISCAAQCHWYRNVTVPEKGSCWEWWGSQGLQLLRVLGRHELEP